MRSLRSKSAMRSRLSAIATVRALVGILGAAALLLACYQMAERYFLPTLGSVWVEESVIYLIAWATFLGCAALVYDDKHVRADVVIRLLSPRGQRYVELLNCLLSIAFCGSVCWLAYLIAADAFAVDERSTTGSSFPIWIFYAALPVGMLLSVVWYLRRIGRLLFGFEAREFSVRSGHDA
jgi:C4-dicarboxylate transporter, DctQ subunit